MSTRIVNFESLPCFIRFLIQITRPVKSPQVGVQSAFVRDIVYVSAVWLQRLVCFGDEKLVHRVVARVCDFDVLRFGSPFRSRLRHPQYVGSYCQCVCVQDNFVCGSDAF